MNVFLVFAFLFFIGSLIGWCIEVVFRKFVSQKRWVNPGFLMGPYLPIYGFGLWGMYFVSLLSSVAMSGNKAFDTVIILVIMMFVMTLIEYIAGLVFVKGMNIKLWDYSSRKFNIQGIICPEFSLIWGLLGCVYYFVINPYVINWVIWLSNHLAFSFVIGMFFGIFIIDLCYSLQIFDNIRRFAKEKEIVVRYEEIKEYLGKRRDELEEKKRFLLAFKSEAPLREHLEKYFEESLHKQEQKIKMLESKIRDKMKNREQGDE